MKKLDKIKWSKKQYNKQTNKQTNKQKDSAFTNFVFALLWYSEDQTEFSAEVKRYADAILWETINSLNSQTWVPKSSTANFLPEFC